MKSIVYSCHFVPAEWIAAHGMQPSRIVPGPTGESGPLTGSSIGLCPYARAFVNAVSSETTADAAVFTTVCDQMRRASELIAGDLPVFLMNVPSTWQTVAAQQLYMSELERLSKFLVRLGGRKPSSSELARVMLDYDAKRSALRASRGRLSPRQYSEAIARFHQAGATDQVGSDSVAISRGVPVALVGGPLLRHDFEIFDLVESGGGYVVLDATGTGERTMPVPFDRRELRDAPFGTLVDAYFGTIPDAFRRPNSELYRWLKKEMAERAIRGVIFKRYVWCDTWHGEAERMREWAEMPVLTIDTDEQNIDRQTASRLQSFLEVLT